MAEALLFKLDSKGRGLRCDQDGLFLGNEPLLERATQNSFQPRASAQIRKILSGAYRAESDWSSRVRSVDVVAKALNNGDVARAMMAAVLMRLPEPGGGIHISDVDGVLAKPATIPMNRGTRMAAGQLTAAMMRSLFLCRLRLPSL
jgi:hypothetical protein